MSLRKYSIYSSPRIPLLLLFIVAIITQSDPRSKGDKGFIVIRLRPSIITVTLIAISVTSSAPSSSPVKCLSDSDAALVTFSSLSSHALYVEAKAADPD
ncbi:MAG: hypothetical protein EZS28_022447 [Streblomastix strix]|uniref:Uncharacterized protein n=1 Tax=Streblomastix strix TaxID=222440 RepID=A0A5J4VHP4_9EUKA|nr:MAG: hypothetical protein EZS28_022447 [Streblomastix strix]